MFRKFIVSASFAVLALPAAAQADEGPVAFVRDGVSYSYVTLQRAGYQILQGTADGARFRLIVNGRKVRGMVDGRWVEFPLRSVPKADTTELAQR